MLLNAASGTGLLADFDISEGVAQGGGGALYQALHLEFGMDICPSVSSDLESLFYTLLAVTSRSSPQLCWQSSSSRDGTASKAAVMYEPFLFRSRVLAVTEEAHRPLVAAMHAVFFGGGTYHTDVTPDIVTHVCAMFL